MSTPYDTLFQQAGDAYGVSPALLSAVAYQESGDNPSAVSPAGAEGIMQLEPGTAASLGVSNPFDPGQAINGAAKLLAQLLGRYQGNVSDALAAYNAGPAAVDQYGGVPPYPETQNYVKSIEARLAQTAGAIDTTAASLLATAAKYLGVPYVYGGSTPAGFDCSGFVQYVLATVGISLPRTTEQQVTQGQSITAGQAAPGDLVFFSDNGTDWSHVGIYLGAGQMIDAPHTGATVRTEPVAGFAPYTQYRRIIPGNSPTNAATVTNAQTVASNNPYPLYDPRHWLWETEHAAGSVASDAFSGVESAISDSVKTVVNFGMKGVFVLGGVGLFVLGLAMAAKTPVERGTQKITETMSAPTAAAGGTGAGAGAGAPAAAAEIPPIA